MMNWYKRLIVFFLFLVSIQSLVSCGVDKEPAIKVGTVVWVGYEPLYLSREKNLLKDKDVKLVEFLSSSQVMRSFRNQLIDVAALTLDEVMLLTDEGMDLSVFLVMDISNGADTIISQKKIKSVKQLKGKKIGYENTAVGAYLLSRALTINGMTSEDIELVTMPVNETESALKLNLVEAVVTFEPIRSKLLSSSYNEIFSSKEIPNEIVDVLVVRKSDLLKHNEKLRNLVVSWFDAIEYIKINPNESMRIMNKRLRLSESELKQSFDGVIFPGRDRNITLLTAVGGVNGLSMSSKALIDEMKKHRLIKNRIDVKEIFNNKFLVN